jgi:hypothetical protein
MPPPANLTALTAVDVGALPAIITQDVEDHDTSTSYSVWHSVTPTVSRPVSVWAFGDLVTYRPTAEVYSGPASSPVLLIAADENNPIQPYLDAGTTYYIRSLVNGGNPTPAILTLDLLSAPNEPTAVNDLIINDDTDGFPAVVLDGTTGTIRRFIQPFPAGENAARTATRLLFTDEFNDTFVLFDTNVTQLGTTANPGSRYHLSASADTFYAGADNGVITLNSAGVIGGTTYLISSSGLFAIGAAQDNSVLYYVNGAPNSAIQQWDIPGNTGLSNLVGGIASYRSTQDILTFADGSVVVGYTGAGEFVGRHYSAAGATLHSYSFDVTSGDSTNRMTRIPGDETSFYIWSHRLVDPIGGGSDISYIARIRISDGAVLSSFTAPVFELGQSQGAASADPPRFGHSFSCPFLALSASIPPDATPLPPGSDDCPCFPPGGSPPGTPGDNTPPEPVPTIPPPTSPPLPPEFEFCDGLGLVPTATPYVPPEVWWGL